MKAEQQMQCLLQLASSDDGKLAECSEVGDSAAIQTSLTAARLSSQARGKNSPSQI